MDDLMLYTKKVYRLQKFIACNVNELVNKYTHIQANVIFIDPGFTSYLHTQIGT